MVRQETAVEAGDRAYREARKRYERDARFRAIVQSVVHEAMGRFIERNPDADHREAHDLAVDVAAILQERLFNEDAELMAQRQLADQYRKIAEDVVALSPPRIFIPGDHPLAQQQG